MIVEDQLRAHRLVPILGAVEAELKVYEFLLRRWQSKINLVGRSTLDDLWCRHFADSAQLVQFAGLNCRWVDLGSGAGFPGMVVALLQKARRVGEMHLIESDSRKAAFLREVSRETEAGAIIHNCRCEDILTDIQPEVLTSRAMADVPTLLDYARPFVENGTTALFLKGRDVGSELTRASIPSNFSSVVIPSAVDPNGVIVKFSLI